LAFDMGQDDGMKCICLLAVAVAMLAGASSLSAEPATNAVPAATPIAYVPT
jgi:hypothetical protein